MSADLLPRVQELAMLALQFGRVQRATRHPDGVRPESDTDHTVMLALIAMELVHQAQVADLPQPVSLLNLQRVLELALVHDLVEVEAGDTNTMGGLTPEQRREKEEREAAALKRLTSRVGFGSRIWAAVMTYEGQINAEARFVRYLDKILPKLTLFANGGVQVRRAGHDVAWLRQRNAEQGAELRDRYPEFADFLGPLFDAAAAAAERSMEAACKAGALPAPRPTVITWKDMSVDAVDSGLPAITFTPFETGESVTYHLAPEAVRGLVDALIGVAEPAPGRFELLMRGGSDDALKAVRTLLGSTKPSASGEVPDGG